MNKLTVSQVNFFVKSIFEEIPTLQNIFVVGEISNFKYYQKSGHMYFTLKDEKSQLKAVMFNSYASRLKFLPEDGMKVIIRGNVKCYERDGIYQLYAEDMQPDGLGADLLALEQLKEKLSKEGLFNESHKKPLPKYPSKIGVATSGIGAAVEDIKNILNRRFPLAQVIISPCLVQGLSAPADIINSVKQLDSIDDVDLIIVGRGGGASEDLSAFNDEGVARAVYNCQKPIISAVGHEVDFTICDLVADMRAPTPSAAAELAVPDTRELNYTLNKYNSILSSSLKSSLESEYQRFDKLSQYFTKEGYQELIGDKLDYIDDLKDRLIETYSHNLEKIDFKFKNNVSKLNALSPLAVLSRGYSVVSKNDEIIKTTKNISIGDKITVKMNDGQLDCSVDEVKNG